VVLTNGATVFSPLYRVRESGDFWTVYYFDENKILRIGVYESTNGSPPWGYHGLFMKKMFRLGCIGREDNYYSAIVEKFLIMQAGKDMSDFIKNAPIYAQRCKEKRERAKSERKRKEIATAQSLKPFDGKVLRIDPKIDYRGVDFAVYVVCRPMSYEERKLFAIENKRELILFVAEWLRQNKRFISKMGDLSLYRLSDITITRSCEIEFLFSLKPVYETLLAEEVV
jgi:hypothetical protein